MKILLVGEFSNAHNNLAQGLRALGHEVSVASNGNHWLGYARDINLVRIIEPGKGILFKVRNLCHLFSFLLRLLIALPSMKDYDVVQLIHPDFFDLKSERLFWFYRYLRRHNKILVLGVYGTDYYYVDGMINKRLLKYSPYSGGDEAEQRINIRLREKEWFGSAKEVLQKEIASSCDAIVACCYEYWLPYRETTDRDGKGRLLKEKLYFVPLAICSNSNLLGKPSQQDAGANLDPKHAQPLRVFIGINKIRASFKGASLMMRVADDLAKKYPHCVVVNKVENVPFATYKNIMEDSDVVIDQIYSYSPGMNALLAMSEGKIVVSGGEQEFYELLGEDKCRPIINTAPTYDSLYKSLEDLVLHPELIGELKRKSREYVIRNHDYMNVAKQMVEIYEKCLAQQSSSLLEY